MNCDASMIAIRALAVGVSATAAAMVLSAPARADDTQAQPTWVPIPAAGKSAVILPDQPDDAGAAPVPAPAAQPPAEPPATDSALVVRVVQEVQKRAAKAVDQAILPEIRPQPAAHPVAVHERVISPRVRTEAGRATRRASRPVRKAFSGWYRGHPARYHTPVAQAVNGARELRGPPLLPGATARLPDRAERPSDGGPICVQGGAICVDSCSLNDLENALQNGDWIVSCIPLPSPPDLGAVGQPTPPGTSSGTSPQPQYQCNDPQYHDVCCELALELPAPTPVECQDVVSAPVETAADDALPVPPESTQPLTGASAPAVGSSGAPGPDVVRPPAPAPSPQAAANAQDGWELAPTQLPRSSGVVAAAVKPLRAVTAIRVPATAKPTPKPQLVPVHAGPVRPTPPQRARSAAPAPRAASPTTKESVSLLVWFFAVAALVLVAALASAAGVDGAAAAVTALRSRLGSKGLSRTRRRTRGGIRYRE
jgi:hypothetical protein